MGQHMHFHVRKILEIHCSHSVQWVYLYPAAFQVEPFAPEQRELKRRSIVKFPYLLYVTIICVLFPIVVCCVKADTTVLVGALFILVGSVKCILIYLVSLERPYSRRWCPGQQVQLIFNNFVIHEMSL